YLVCAGAGLAVALLGVWTPGATSWLASTVPGGGLLRDGTRYLGLLALLEASVFGTGAAVLAGSGRDRLARSALAVGVVLAPLALMPDLAWGALGRLQPVDYPASYAGVRAILRTEAAGSRADLLVLPFTSYRAPGWNGGRKVLDPLGRYMTPDYVASDRLSINQRVLAGEDPRVRAVVRGLGRPTPAARAAGLRSVGIGFVLGDSSAPGAGTSRYDPPVAGRQVARTGSLRLTSFGGPVAAREASTADRLAVAVGFGLYAAAVLAAVGRLSVRRARTLATQR
ncbi:MAG: hypothetical protein ACJ72B_18090, partial [Ornithinibacter sp.]